MQTKPTQYAKMVKTLATLRLTCSQSAEEKYLDELDRLWYSMSLEQIEEANRLVNHEGTNQP